MLYAILACHIEEEVTSWTPQVDAALMADLDRVHNRLTQEGRLGPAARLGTTKGACFLRGRGKGVVNDGPSPRPGNSCSALTSSTAPTATPRSPPRAICARPIPVRCMKSALSGVSPGRAIPGDRGCGRRLNRRQGHPDQSRSFP